MLRGTWLLALLGVARAAGQWRADDLPSATKSPCGQGFRMCDPDGYFKDASGIEKAINVLEKDYEYPNCGGYEMGVVVVRSILGGGNAQSTAAFARAVMDAWGVGKPACNNGILLAMAIEDRQMFVATGRGAKEHVSDSELEQIIERMKPLMREWNYAGAAEQCASDIARVLSGESFVPSGWTTLLWILGGVAFFAIMSKAQARDRRRYEDCKKKLVEIDRQRVMARAKQYEQTSCAICLETFGDTPQLATEILICGHRFHKECVSAWEDRSGSCPICRQSTTEAMGSPGSTSQVFSRRPCADSTYEDEYRFRLRRAHHFYPRYVTDDMVNRWSRSEYCGQIQADTAFVRSAPGYEAPGSSSSSGGFSGGSSGGGGGAGGSW